MPRDLVNVVRDGPDQALQVRQLHELITPFRRAFAVLVQRRFDQEPWDRDTVLLSQGKQLGLFFGADLDLVTVHPATVNVRAATAGLPTGEAVAFTHAFRPSPTLPAQRPGNPGIRHQSAATGTQFPGATRT